MIGNKAEGLHVLAECYPTLVPPFVVLPFAEVIENWAGLRTDAEALVQAYLADVTPDAEYDSRAAQLVDAIVIDEARLLELMPAAIVDAWSTVSVRTSALAEDGVHDSFAGQYVTTLDSTPAEVSARLRDCVASLFSRAVASYAKHKGLDRLDIGGSAVVQRMFYGHTTGVLFSENGKAEVELAWSESARNTTVEGDNAHSLRVSKLSAVPESLPFPPRLVEIALELEAALGHPLDIEWAARGGTIALLQLRPQTVSSLRYELAWDCSNIAENYPGITLPLSYSFIRGLYSRVYPHFFRLLGVSRDDIAAHAHIFQNILGYLNGHVYYQIDNWYEMVRLIPGSKHNEAFFTAMLQPVRDGEARHRTRPGVLGSIILGALGLRLAILMTGADARSRRFSAQFGDRYRRYQALDWDALSADAILKRLEVIRSELLGLWATPILNDLRVMIFHGLLKTWSFGDARHASYLAYLRGLTDRASLAPIAALARLGEELRAAHPHAATADQVMASTQWESTQSLVEQYLNDFGGRTPDELQLENPRLSEDHAAVVSLALGTALGERVETLAHEVGRVKFGTAFIGRQARKAIDWRERFRFNRAQVYGIARAAYLALGRRLVETGMIDASEDVFWLTEVEVEGVVFGHSWDHDLRGTIQRRQAQAETFDAAPLGRRMVGEGMLAPLALRADTPAESGARLAGMGVAPGVLEAEVVVVGEFDPAVDVHGKILVTSHIDPGWTLLFVQAAGVITERGNALSHVAIIARELGMPAIVAAVGATTALTTGDTVRMDGTTGAIDAVD